MKMMLGLEYLSEDVAKPEGPARFTGIEPDLENVDDIKALNTFQADYRKALEIATDREKKRIWC